MAAINLSKIAMVFGILICLFNVAVGVVGCVRSNLGQGLTIGSPYDTSTHNRNGHFAIFFAAVVLILMSVLALFGELSLGPLKRMFGWFSNYFVRSIYYLIVALLALGIAGDLGFASFIITLVYVVLLFVLGIMSKKSSSAE